MRCSRPAVKKARRHPRRVQSVGVGFGNDMLVSIENPIGGNGNEDLAGNGAANERSGGNGTRRMWRPRRACRLLARGRNGAVDGSRGFVAFVGSDASSTTDATGQVRHDTEAGIVHDSTDADAGAAFSMELPGAPALVAEESMIPVGCSASHFPG